MPELPEVENVVRSLTALGPVGQTFSSVVLNAPKLRTPLKKNLRDQLPGQRIKSLKRRAKFMLIETDDFVILNHLGMTGSWRPFHEGETLIKHDHVIFNFASGLKLVFNDPRRFGMVELLPKEKLEQHKSIKQLGLEPLDERFSGAHLFESTRGLSLAIKSFLMDQRRVVGVGNIYASEALFQARIKPMRPAGRLKADEADRLAVAIKEILKSAIEKGGSTIRDFKDTNGQSGRYQNEFFVYGRDGESCRSCGAKIRSKFITGRNTYWCAQCQR